MTKIAESHGTAWILFHSDQDGFLLAVLCGSIDLYEVRIVLTNEEEHWFQAEGTPFLDGLARDIARNEHLYTARFIGRAG